MPTLQSIEEEVDEPLKGVDSAAQTIGRRITNGRHLTTTTTTTISLPTADDDPTSFRGLKKRRCVSPSSMDESDSDGGNASTPLIVAEGSVSVQSYENEDEEGTTTTTTTTELLTIRIEQDGPLGMKMGKMPPDGATQVLEIAPNSLAKRVGFQVGDTLFHPGTDTTRALSYDEFMQMLAGPAFSVRPIVVDVQRMRLSTTSGMNKEVERGVEESTSSDDRGRKMMLQESQMHKLSKDATATAQDSRATADEVLSIRFIENGPFGIKLGKMRSDGVTQVLAVAPGSQAFRAGLRVGDVLCRPGTGGSRLFPFEEVMTFLAKQGSSRPFVLEVKRMTKKLAEAEVEGAATTTMMTTTLPVTPKTGAKDGMAGGAVFGRQKRSDRVRPPVSTVRSRPNGKQTSTRRTAANTSAKRAKDGLIPRPCEHSKAVMGLDGINGACDRKGVVIGSPSSVVPIEFTKKGGSFRQNRDRQGSRAEEVEDDDTVYEEPPSPGHVCKDFMFYCTIDDETCGQVACKIGCSWRDLANEEENKSRYGLIRQSSRFEEGTLLRIPEQSCDSAKVRALVDSDLACAVSTKNDEKDEGSSRRKRNEHGFVDTGLRPERLQPGESSAAMNDRVSEVRNKQLGLAITFDGMEKVTPNKRRNIGTYLVVEDGDDGTVYEEPPSPGHVCKDMVFYSTIDDETCGQVAKKLGCLWRDLADSEENRSRYGCIRHASRFEEGTLLRIPESRDFAKVQALIE